MQQQPEKIKTVTQTLMKRLDIIQNCTCYVCETSKKRKTLDTDVFTYVNYNIPSKFDLVVFVVNSPLFIKTMFDRYQSILKNDKKEYALQMLVTQPYCNRISTNFFMIENQRICFNLWCFIYGFNHTWMYGIRKLLVEQQFLAITKPMYIPEATLKPIIINFLTEYCDIMAEWDPTGRKALLPKFNKKQMHERLFRHYCETKHLPFTSYSYFIKIWLQNFKHVRMTQKQRFSICAECQRYNDQIQKSSNLNDKLFFILKKSAHLEEVRNARRQVLYWKEYAEKNPTEVLFWSVDRMDQMKTSMPHEYRPSKKKLNLERLRVSIQAYISSVLPHGNFFWNAQNTRKNTNQHIFTDLLMIENIVKRSHKLPPKLVICMDNTASENKNYKYFQWAVLLLALNIFDEIEWIFLPVGHTHFVNDQVFSVFSRYINNNINGIKTLEEFCKLLRDSWHYQSDNFNFNQGSMKTCITDFPDFDYWLSEVSRKYTWPSSLKFNITKYKRFIFTIDPTTIRVHCFTNTLTRSESIKYLSNENFSMLFRQNKYI